MIAAIRAFAKSWFAKALLSVLILSFVIFGVGSFRDVFRQRISDAVVTAGSRQISSAQFKRMFDNYKRAAEQQNGQQAGLLQDAVAQHLDTRVLQEVATNEAIGGIPGAAAGWSPAAIPFTSPTPSASSRRSSIRSADASTRPPTSRSWPKIS